MLLGRIGKARAKVRARVWDLLERRPQGFPWLAVAGKLLTGWIVIDLVGRVPVMGITTGAARRWLTLSECVGQGRQW